MRSNPLGMAASVLILAVWALVATGSELGDRLPPISSCPAASPGTASTPGSPACGPEACPPIATSPAEGCGNLAGTWATDALEVSIGFRTWFSWGDSDDRISLQGGGTSEFRFRDIDSIVYELNLDAVMRDMFVARIDVGFGVIDEGTFESIDTGVLPSPGVGIGDDDLFYVSADVGYRLLNGLDPCGRRWIVDLLAGYQYWQETYVPDALFRDEYTWNSIRMGGRGILETERWRLQGRLLVVPWTHFRSENVDLASGGVDYVIKGDGGVGVMADVSFSYRVWRGLSLEVGYQIFHLDAGDGLFETGASDSPFEDARSTRHGFLFGVNFRF